MKLTERIDKFLKKEMNEEIMPILKELMDKVRVKEVYKKGDPMFKKLEAVSMPWKEWVSNAEKHGITAKFDAKTESYIVTRLEDDTPLTPEAKKNLLKGK